MLTDVPIQVFLQLLLRLQQSGPEEPPFAQCGITPAQYAYLDSIARQPGAALQAITADLQVSPASASNAVRLLESLDLVQRQPHPRDGRSYCFSLTPQGEDIHQRINRYREEKARALLVRLEPAEQEQFLRLFTRLLNPPTINLSEK